MINLQDLMSKTWTVVSSLDATVMAGDTLVFTPLAIEQWHAGTQIDWPTTYAIVDDEITGSMGGRIFHIRFETPKKWSCSFSDPSTEARQRRLQRTAVTAGTLLGTLVGVVTGIAAGFPFLGLLTGLSAALTAAVTTSAMGSNNLRIVSGASIVAEDGSGIRPQFPIPELPGSSVSSDGSAHPPLRVAARR